MNPPSSLVATRLDATIAHRTWSLASTGRDHLFFLRTGRAVLTRDAFEPAEIGPPALLWMPVTTRASLQILAGGDGFAVSVAREFAQRTVADAPLTAPLRPLLDQPVIAGAEALGARAKTLAAAFESLVEEGQALLPGASAIIGLQLGVLLVQLWRCAGLYRTAGARGPGISTAQRFRQLVELHYRDGLQIDEFARRLGVSRAHLHDSCRRATGRTPLALLHDRLLAEARARLEQTDLSVEQVGYGIGFRDPGYFNRFFKRLAGRSPGAHRRDANTARSETPPPPSFAAWP